MIKVEAQNVAQKLRRMLEKDITVLADAYRELLTEAEENFTSEDMPGTQKSIRHYNINSNRGISSSKGISSSRDEVSRWKRTRRSNSRGSSRNEGDWLC